MEERDEQEERTHAPGEMPEDELIEEEQRRVEDDDVPLADDDDPEDDDYEIGSPPGPGQTEDDVEQQLRDTVSHFAYQLREDSDNAAELVPEATVLRSIVDSLHLFRISIGKAKPAAIELHNAPGADEKD